MAQDLMLACKLPEVAHSPWRASDIPKRTAHTDLIGVHQSVQLVIGSPEFPKHKA